MWLLIKIDLGNKNELLKTLKKNTDAAKVNHKSAFMKFYNFLFDSL